jgi:hypothetical protein
MWSLLFSLLTGVAVLQGTISSAREDSPSIEELLKSGWQIAGYSQAFDNRSTFQSPREIFPGSS